MPEARYSYPVNVDRDAAGWLLVTSPDFPEAATDGETLAEALSEAHDCLDEALAGRIVRQEPIPVPSPARRRHMAVPSAVIATKTALYEALRRKGLSEAAFARVMRIHAGDVRRMLDPAHSTSIGSLARASASSASA